jgi:hypothetical protein
MDWTFFWVFLGGCGTGSGITALLWSRADNKARLQREWDNRHSKFITVCTCKDCGGVTEVVK